MLGVSSVRRKRTDLYDIGVQITSNVFECNVYQIQLTLQLMLLQLTNYDGHTCDN